ncbi:MAG: hypothetical protein ACRERC_18580 [Candidatus Binatia bacterium]
MRLVQRATVVCLLLLSATAYATSMPDCCVCASNCPQADTQVCFALHAAEDCNVLCSAISCAASGPARDACTTIPACDETGSGRCADGFDNNVNGLIDCADPGCAGSGLCAQEVPAIGGTGLASLGAVLALFGAWRISRRRSA